MTHIGNYAVLNIMEETQKKKMESPSKIQMVINLQSNGALEVKHHE